MSYKESQTTEFKSNWRDGYLKTICAFANTNGGKIFIGVSDDGNILGVKNVKKLMEDIPNKIKNKVGITPSVEIESKKYKDIIRISVNSSPIPISYEGKYYIRSGSTTSELKGNELSHFIMKKIGKTWDGISSDADFHNIDIDTVENFKNLAKNRVPSISKLDSIEKIFSNLKLTTDKERLTNAAILLFGKDPQKFFISAKTRVGRFKTTTDITDTVIAEGNLFNQLEITIEAIKKHLNVRFEIKDIERQDIWDYPIEAIREAVLNSLIHKDYSSTAEIQIKIYNDKIWIWNSGKLPEELSIEDLKKEHSSYPKNPLIANVFYLAGFIERWGSGTKRMVDLFKGQGLPEPEYKEEQGGFSVWFYKDIYTEENLLKVGLNERQIKAVMYVKEKRKITNKDYQNEFLVSRQTASRDLTELTDKGLFALKGTGKRDAHYTLNEAKNSQMRQK